MHFIITLRSSLDLLFGCFRQFLTKLSARLISICSFREINGVNANGFSPNLVCALMMWRFGLGLLNNFVKF